jgi:CheY-like chemotaxis protein
MKKLQKVLIIDDDDSDIFFLSQTITRAAAADCIHSIPHPVKALQFFKTVLSDENSLLPIPELIFLDINMPALSGFELLDDLKAMPDPYQRKQHLVIVMLSGSINPDDAAKAGEQYRDMLKGYYQKPLTNRHLIEIIEQHFPLVAGE